MKNIFKSNKVTLIVTTLTSLFPILAGVILWKSLPDKIAINFSGNNVPNDWASKEFTVFVMPLIVTAIHWITIISTSSDAERGRINSKMLNIIYWFCPVISIFMFVIIYSYALGAKPNVVFCCMVLLGIFLIITGNYLPKCKSNGTVGIRCKYTLSDEDNWNKTHRFAGCTMTVWGFLLICAACFGIEWLGMLIIPISVLLPIIYSAIYHKKKHAK